MEYTGRAAWSNLIAMFFSCLLELFRRTLPSCLAVRRQKGFVNRETSPDFPLSWGLVNNDQIYIIELTIHLKQMYHLMQSQLCYWLGIEAKHM